MAPSRPLLVPDAHDPQSTRIAASIPNQHPSPPDKPLRPPSLPSTKLALAAASRPTTGTRRERLAPQPGPAGYATGAYILTHRGLCAYTPPPSFGVRRAEIGVRPRTRMVYGRGGRGRGGGDGAFVGLAGWWRRWSMPRRGAPAGVWGGRGGGGLGEDAWLCLRVPGWMRMMWPGEDARLDLKLGADGDWHGLGVPWLRCLGCQGRLKSRHCSPRARHELPRPLAAPTRAARSAHVPKQWLTRNPLPSSPQHHDIRNRKRRQVLPN